jgi:hypothetical protein
LQVKLDELDLINADLLGDEEDEEVSLVCINAET